MSDAAVSFTEAKVLLLPLVGMDEMDNLRGQFAFLSALGALTYP